MVGTWCLVHWILLNTLLHCTHVGLLVCRPNMAEHAQWLGP